MRGELRYGGYEASIDKNDSALLWDHVREDFKELVDKADSADEETRSVIWEAIWLGYQCGEIDAQPIGPS